MTFGSLQTRVCQVNSTHNQILSHSDRISRSPENHSTASTPVVRHIRSPHTALIGSHNRAEQHATSVPMFSPSGIPMSTDLHINSHARPPSSGSHPSRNLHRVNANTAPSAPPPVYPNEHPSEWFKVGNHDLPDDVRLIGATNEDVRSTIERYFMHVLLQSATM